MRIFILKTQNKKQKQNKIIWILIHPHKPGKRETLEYAAGYHQPVLTTTTATKIDF